MNDEDREEQCSPEEWQDFPVPEEVWKKIVGLVKNIPGMEDWLNKQGVEVTKESSLASLETDSLDRIEFRMECEDTFDVHMEDEQVEGCENLGQLASLISWLISKKPPVSEDSK